MPGPNTVGEANIALHLDASRLNAEFAAAIGGLNRHLVLAGAAGGASYGRELVGAISSNLRTLQGLIGVGLGVEAFRRVSSEILRVGAMFDQLEQRMAFLTGSGAVVDRIVESANRMGQSIEDAAQAFSRIAVPARELGLSSRDIVTLHQTLAALGRIGGTTAGELRNALYQITQAMASGRLGGDELRSMMENMALATQLLAKELGVGVGQLRKLGEEGKITGDVLARALIGNAEQILNMFDRLPPTIDQVHARLINAFEVMFNTIDKRWSLSAFYKDFIQGGLIQKINQLTKLIEESGRPTPLESELQAAGLPPTGGRPVETRREQLQQFLARGETVPTVAEAEAMQQRAAEWEAWLSSIIDSVRSVIEKAVKSWDIALNDVVAEVEGWKNKEDRDAAQRLMTVVRTINRTLTDNLTRLFATADAVVPTTIGEEANKLIDAAAEAARDLPRGEVLAQALKKLEEHVASRVGLMNDVDRLTAKALDDLVADVRHSLQLTRLPESDELEKDLQNARGVLFERLSARAAAGSLDLRSDEVRQMLEQELHPLFERVRTRSGAQPSGPNRHRFAAMQQAIIDRFVSDVADMYAEAAAQVGVAIGEAVTRTTRDYLRGEVATIRDEGVARYVTQVTDEELRFRQDLQAEPARKAAELEAQKQLTGEYANRLNAIRVLNAQIIGESAKLLARLDADNRHVITVLEQLDAALDRIRAARARNAEKLPASMQPEAEALLQEAETAMRTAAGLVVKSIRDKEADALIGRLETIRDAADASTRRLLSDEEKIALALEERERALARIAEEEKEIQKLVGERRDRAQAVTEDARQAVIRKTDLQIADIRDDAAAKALDTIEKTIRAAEEAQTRYLEFDEKLRQVQDKTIRAFAELDEAAEARKVATPEKAEEIAKRHAAAIAVLSESAATQVAGLSEDEAEDALRIHERIVELGERALASANSALTPQQALARIERERLAVHAELERSVAEFADKAAHLSREQRERHEQDVALARKRVDDAAALRAEEERARVRNEVEREIASLKNDALAGDRKLIDAAERILRLQGRTKEALASIAALREKIAILSTTEATSLRARLDQLTLLVTTSATRQLEAIIEAPQQDFEKIIDRIRRMGDEAERSAGRQQTSEERINAIYEERDRKLKEISRELAEAQRYAGEVPVASVVAGARTAGASIASVNQEAELRVAAVRADMERDFISMQRQILELKRSLVKSTEDELSISDEIRGIQMDTAVALQTIARLRADLVTLSADDAATLETQLDAMLEFIKRSEDARIAMEYEKSRAKYDDLIRKIEELGFEAERGAARQLSYEEQLNQIYAERDRKLAELQRRSEQLGEHRDDALFSQKTRADEAQQLAEERIQAEAVRRAEALRLENERNALSTQQALLRLKKNILDIDAEAPAIATELEGIELDIAEALQSILELRAKALTLAEADAEVLTRQLDTLQDMVAAWQQNRVEAIYQQRRDAFDRVIEQIRAIGETAERAIDGTRTGEEQINAIYRERDRLVESIREHQEDAANKGGGEIPFTQRAEAEDAIERSRAAVMERADVEAGRVRSRIAEDVSEALERAANAASAAQMKVVPLPLQMRLVDEQTARMIARINELRAQLGAFIPGPRGEEETEEAYAARTAELDAKRRQLAADLDDAERLLRVQADARKTYLAQQDADRGRSGVRAVDRNAEVILDLENMLNTVADDRERFILRFIDRLNEQATEADSAMVRKLAGQVYDKEQVDRERERILRERGQLRLEDIPDIEFDARREELELAAELKRITQEQLALEMAREELRKRGIPMDAPEVADFLRATEDATRRMKAVELERERLDLARDWADTVVDGLEGITLAADDATDALKDMVRELASLTLRHAVFDPAAKGLSTAFHTGFTALRAAFGFASGGIMSSLGPVPIPAGRVSAPTIGVFGEGALAEAAVPLPDGRNIPVDLTIDGQIGGARAMNIAIDARASIDPALVTANAHRAAVRLMQEMQRRQGTR